MNHNLSVFCCLLLASVQTHAGSLHRTEAQRQLESAQQLLAIGSGVAGAGLKEITQGCVPTPMPTTALGPSWSFEVLTSASQRVRGTAWRQPCGGNDAQLVLTLQPLVGTPFVCGADMQISIGAARTDNLFLDVNPNDGVASNFCANLAATTSFVIHEYDNGFSFDDDAAFLLEYESDFGPDASIAIPAYDPALYAGGGSTSVAISGKLSGSYYASTRNGEGAILEVGTVGARRVLFLTWYTYFQGQQRWLVGSVDLSAGSSQATVPMFLTSGGQFGSAFDPSQVSVTPWGNVVVQFTSCSNLRFQWNEAGGASGSYNYTRTLDALDGIACP